MATLNILLVEDQASWQNILRSRIAAALRNLSQADAIRITATFEEAWGALDREGPWHLMVTDIGLGRHKLGKQLVERAHDLQVPCIVVSNDPSLTPQEVRDMIKELGASDFFGKDDFDSRKFTTLVQETLQMAIASPPASTIEHPAAVPEGYNAKSHRPAARGTTPSPTRLRSVIAKYFNLEELRTLCSDLGVDYDNFEGGKQAIARELVGYFERRSDLERLVSAVRGERGNII